MKFTNRKAIIGDLSELQSHYQPSIFKRLVMQVQRSEQSMTVLRDGQVLAVAGLYPVDGIFRLWFLTSPELRGKRAAAVVVIAMRKALQKVTAPVEMYVRPGHVTGFRLAALLGFAPAGVLDGVGWLRFTINT